jgi:hypothetical protein
MNMIYKYLVSDWDVDVVSVGIELVIYESHIALLSYGLCDVVMYCSVTQMG